MRNSYFCENHSSHKELLNFFVDEQLQPFEVNNIVPIHLNDKKKISKIHDFFINENYQTLYLVEINSYEKKTCWVKSNNIDSKQLQDFKSKYEERFNEIVYKEINCNTNKHYKSFCDNKIRTQGLLISSFNCGIINGYREIFGSESISQVVLFYLDLIEKSNKDLPEYFIYDDACHVKKYLDTRKDLMSSDRGQKLLNKKHFIDKLHFSNHKDPWCIENCDPFKEKNLENVNTVVSEEINYWLSGFKYILKHMNFSRYHFFLFVILDKYNSLKIKKLK
jgi:hypothetical protein